MQEFSLWETYPHKCYREVPVSLMLILDFLSQSKDWELTSTEAQQDGEKDFIKLGSIFTP